MGTSAIPLFGLPHTVSVISKADSEDAARNITASGAETSIYSNLVCRISTLGGNYATPASYGLPSGEYWRVVAEYSPNIVRNHFIRVPSGLPYIAGDYRVLWVRNHVDHLGNTHHTEIIMERE